MRARIKKFFSLIGPYPYNPYLIFLLFFTFYFSRYIRAVTYLPAGPERWRAGGLIVLASAIPSIILSVGSILLTRFRFWSSKSTVMYVMEVAFIQYLNSLALPLVLRFLQVKLHYFDKTIIGLSKSIFIASLLLVLFALALMNRAERKISDRLNLATKLVEKLEIEREKLIQSDEKLRRQTSQFLHDRVQSDLMVVALELKRSPGKTQEEIESVISRSVQSLERIRSVEVRHLAQLLTPNFEAGGLKAALDILVSQYKTSMAIDLNIDESCEEFNEEVRLGIYRIIEQSLLNALLHGPAKRVLVTLSHNDLQNVRLEVSDDGPGTPLKENATGVGTAVIDSWVGILNGKKMVESQPGHGYRLQVEFPK
jgi:signal transduction histidine kinase